MEIVNWRHSLSSRSPMLSDLRMAMKQISRQIPSTSAPVAYFSSSERDTSSRTTFLLRGMLFKRRRSISFISSKFGKSIKKCSCNLPGRNKAESILSIRFVHPTTKTRLERTELDTPSISFSRVDRILDPKSLVSSVSRFDAIASISSRSKIQGEAALARENTLRIRASDPPSHLSKTSEARIWISGRPNDAAKHLAAVLLPVPLGPWNKTPGGGSGHEDSFCVLSRSLSSSDVEKEPPV
mmetsp:Transcript_4016/g.9883  ORF Transcript_4016/g.9883 Transcript_4016/m.9883 type:complete len:240 (-) Transcript_4016:1600-2319(-)